MTHNELVAAIKYIVPDALEFSGYTITTDAAGNATIATWDASLGTEPTATQLTSALSAVQLAQAQSAQINLLVTAYEGNGYAPISYMSTTFPCGPSTLLLLSCTLVQAATPQGLPSGFQWFDNTGTGVQMTLADLQGLGNAIFAQTYAAYGKLGLIKQVESATTVQEVQAVVWA